MQALIADSEELYRLSLKEVVRASATFESVIEVGTEHSFVTAAAGTSNISLVVVRPASLGRGAADFIKLVRRLYPDAALVTITEGQEIPLDTAGTGLSVPRSAPVGMIIKTIRRALQLPVDHIGHTATQPARPDVGAAMRGHRTGTNGYRLKEETVDLGRLSFRQKQILAMAADGLPNKEIAARLDIAEGTVKAHMHAIFKVLGVSNRTQAVIRYGATGQDNGRFMQPATGWMTAGAV
ncbi:helix-turn-helix transcriptional regulator [Gimibacter soli]|uniref:Response regulator transcription factor n=1 Tax=Gimibacter soli TaxID=3024400 RepID=A0AAF0BL82_9PROT|nr:response regulator transcription factor [Gimibacter soli]WCL55154.1 response regulator transcription factor [Gimibacter soli]